MTRAIQTPWLYSEAIELTGPEADELIDLSDLTLGDVVELAEPGAALAGGERYVEAFARALLDDDEDDDGDAADQQGVALASPLAVDGLNGRGEGGVSPGAYLRLLEARQAVRERRQGRQGRALDMAGPLDGSGLGLFGAPLVETSPPTGIPESDPDDPYGHAGRPARRDAARDEWLEAYKRENPHVVATTAGRSDRHPLHPNGISDELAGDFEAPDGPRVGPGFHPDGTQRTHGHQPLHEPDPWEHQRVNETEFEGRQRLAYIDAPRLAQARSEASEYLRRLGMR